MILVFPIVGLRHYLPETDLPELITSLPDGAEVTLMYDNANAHDRYAIQAWMELSVEGEHKRMQVGYVASDFAPMIQANYPDAQLLCAYVVHPDTNDTPDTFFEVEMEELQAIYLHLLCAEWLKEKSENHLRHRYFPKHKDSYDEE